MVPGSDHINAVITSASNIPNTVHDITYGYDPILPLSNSAAPWPWARNLIRGLVLCTRAYQLLLSSVVYKHICMSLQFIMQTSTVGYI